MRQNSRLEVINKEGWRKEYPLLKNIVYVGSAPSNDISLESLHGAGVAPMHVQLIASNSDQSGYKLINLSDSVISLGSTGEQTLPPRAVLDMADGQTFVLGDFTLIFRSNGQSQAAGATNIARTGDGGRHIGLGLSMPYTQLAPNQSLEGIVTVTNQGERTAVNFELHLEGMDPDCYDIAPGPLLSSGAHKDVIFHLHHRGMKPLAGEWRISIRATAPKSYPGQQAVVTTTIQVLPYYRHHLRILPAEGITASSPPQEITGAAWLAPKAQMGSLAPQEAGPVDSESVAEDVWNVTEEAAVGQPAPIKLKVKPAPRTTTEQPIQAGPGPEAEDLWAAPVETTPPLQVQPALSPQAEDLWAAPAEVEAEGLPVETAATPPAESTRSEDGEATAAESSPVAEARTELKPPLEPGSPAPAEKVPASPAEAEPETPAQPQDPAEPTATPPIETTPPEQPQPSLVESPPVQPTQAEVQPAATQSEPTLNQIPPKSTAQPVLPAPRESDWPQPKAEEKKQTWWDRLIQTGPFGRVKSQESLPAAEPLPEMPAKQISPPEPDIEPGPETEVEPIADVQVESIPAEAVEPDSDTTVILAKKRGGSETEPDVEVEAGDETETVVLAPKQPQQREQQQTILPPQPEAPQAEFTAADARWSNAPAEQETKKSEAEQKSKVADQQPPEESATEGDDWGEAEPKAVEAVPPVSEKQVLKIKASPPPQTGKKQPPDPDDWWSAEEE